MPEILSGFMPNIPSYQSPILRGAKGGAKVPGAPQMPRQRSASEGDIRNLYDKLYVENIVSRDELRASAIGSAFSLLKEETNQDGDKKINRDLPVMSHQSA
jgi:hypothetical protein